MEVAILRNSWSIEWNGMDWMGWVGWCRCEVLLLDYNLAVCKYILLTYERRIERISRIHGY